MTGSRLPRLSQRERALTQGWHTTAWLAATPTLTRSSLAHLSQRERPLTRVWHTTARLAPHPYLDLSLAPASFPARGALTRRWHTTAHLPATRTLTRSSLARLPARENGFQSHSEAQPAVHHATSFSFSDRRHRAATAGNASTPLRSRPLRRPNSVYVNGRKDSIFFSKTSGFLENPETQFRAP